MPGDACHIGFGTLRDGHTLTSRLCEIIWLYDALYRVDDDIEAWPKIRAYFRPTFISEKAVDFHATFSRYASRHATSP